MSRRYTTNGTIHWYLLEPGDSTRYEFGFWLVDKRGFAADAEGNPSSIQDAMPSIYRDGHDVMLFISNGSRTGCTTAYLWDLEHLGPDDHCMVSYLCDWMPAVDNYTVIAVCAAVAVLVKNPMALDKACEAMLRVHGRLEGR